MGFGVWGLGFGVWFRVEGAQSRPFFPFFVVGFRFPSKPLFNQKRYLTVFLFEAENCPLRLC